MDGEELHDDNFTDNPPKNPRTNQGDIYILGNHRLICGDCTDIKTVEYLMDGFVADVTITSPPYGAANSAKIRTHYERGKSVSNSFYNTFDDNAGDWLNLMRNSFKCMQSASSAQFVNVQLLADNKRDLITWVYENKDAFCDVIVWDKKASPPQMKERVLNNRFEFVFVFGNEGASRQIPFSDFHGNKTNIIELNPGNNEYSDIHRATFPVKFPAEIMNMCNNAQSIFEPFGGTGTTMIACEQMGKRCFMCELDPAYCDLIVDRWESFTGKRAVKLDEKSGMEKHNRGIM